jgi:DNA polymerase-1
MISVAPIQRDGMELFMRGQQSLAKISANGFVLDIRSAEADIASLQTDILALDNALSTDPHIKAWKAHYKDAFNLDSIQQLSWLLYTHIGINRADVQDIFDDEDEAGGAGATDKTVLARTGVSFVPDLLARRGKSKMCNTYLKGLVREADDEGIVHPSYSILNPISYRSSASMPNSQNMPIRDKEKGRMIRDKIRPRPGRCLGEIDLSGAEVRTGACYHKDGSMIKYINDPSTDMHRDSACDLVILNAAEVPKVLRQACKGDWVFAQFYGSVFKQCVPRLWRAFDGIKLSNGMFVKEWLATHGITERGACQMKHNPAPGTFEEHAQKAERYMWDRRFAGYSKWKRDMYDQYAARGYIDSLTGFRYSGFMRKNEACNYPIQGSSFHLLLWCLCELQDEIEKRGLSTLIIGQIHDSILLDMPPNEVSLIVELADDIIVNRTRKRFSWLCVPLAYEAEIAPVDMSWFHKKVYSKEDWK